LIRVAGYYTDSIIDGNKGIDTIIIGEGIHSGSSVNGGEGNDIVRSDGLSKGLVINGDKGNDTIASGSASDFSAALGATITGGEGNDTIVSFTKSGEKSKIDAGVGAEVIFTVDTSASAVSKGTETIVFNAGDSVAATKATISVGTSNKLDSKFKITYGNGVDLLAGIDTSDKIDIDFDPADLVKLNNKNLTDVLASNVVYEVTGLFTASTGLFEVGKAGGTDYIYIVGGDNLTVGQVFTNSTNKFVTNDALVLSDFG